MKSRHFTLIEILVTIGIIALLAAMLTPAVNSALKKGEVTECRSTMTALSLALEEYYNTYHAWPVNVNSNGVIKYTTLVPDYQALIKELQGEAYKKNVRKKKFLDVQGNTPGQLQDPWTNDFEIYLSPSHNGKISNGSIPGLVLKNGSTTNVLYKDILIFSKGPKGEMNTTKANEKNEDNVYSVDTEWVDGSGHEIIK